MFTKVKKILGSVRFWIIALTAVLAVLNGADVIPTIEAALAAVVGVGSLDSFGTKLSGR